VSLPRFHVPEAAPGARVLFPDHSAHHAREVLRLRSGDEVRVFDGRGSEFAGTLETVTRRSVEARLAGVVVSRPESGLRIILALSPLKGDLMEWVIQKATELGAAEIHPVVTARTDAVARPALKGSRQERWEKVASGAAEQSGRAVVPWVAPTTTLDRFLETNPPGLKLLLLETQGLPPLSRAATGPLEALTLLLGPAGGWEHAEAARIEAAGFRAVSLGPRVLRAETAAIAAVGIAQALWGDLH
jgi:16S rRNA (uracil1498-N3)-methyltransferase